MTTTTSTCEQPWFVLNSSGYWVMHDAHSAISHFYALEVDQPADLTYAVPDGCVDILFDCDSHRPTARVCGTPLRAKRVELLNRHRYFGVRFQPGVIPGFVANLTGELAEQEVDLCDVLPCAQQLIEQIAQATALGNQADVFSRLAGQSLARRTSGLSGKLVEFIIARRGDIRVHQLEAMSGYTSRTLQRQFREDTGIAPKTFCRIIRCQAALSSLTADGTLPCSELALELGFTDQSHFMRDFKALVSTTPNDYQRRVTQGAYNGRIRVLGRNDASLKEALHNA
ncbi:helix-turn-helix domain-containing protein [Pseudomonas sp. LJDD11]|uniref:AraC family transcriptional regulator n=1 Tax=Pseudomonas sp. LJDD11 TaxID=2931984 RepID=UPI00211BB64D|nr:helix-turn-helix domain-containing protein [Pseudomonas sp. LJDD11]MCQ9422941.1 helix-turn-helix domain-containing protein [Pseudomonas sp. LJDD11]